MARGAFPDGTETIYTSRFHLIEPNVRLVYAFDMHVAGEHFLVSLDGVELRDAAGGTELANTEHGFFLVGDYDAHGRTEGDQLAPRPVRLPHRHAPMNPVNA